ncbi:MAG: hypothetical protein GXP39_07025 [Chloroflexi bacterium]|nr:hypothetical protein [Chloroflexota bacterium]
MREFFIPLLSHLIGELPVLFVYVVGIILSLAFWRRYPRPCALTLIAMALLILALIGQASMGAYFAYRGPGLGLEPGRLGQMLMVRTLISSLVRALAFGLLLAAIFAGREPQGEA